MSDKYNPSNMKKIVGNIESARASIVGKKNISVNMENLKNSFQQLQPMMKGQAVYIKSLNSIEKENKTESEKASESKRYLMRIIEIVRAEMTQYLEIAKNSFQLNKKQKKIEQGWEKIQNQLEKKLNFLKQSANPNNIFELIFKILNARDAIQRQFLRSLLYKKNSLWLDLNVPFQNFVHGEIDNILKMIKEHKQKYNYVPTKMEFVSPTFEQEGKWKLSPSIQQYATTPTFFKIVLQDFDEMSETIKNYSKLNETSDVKMFEDINKNQFIVKGLREKIQVLTKSYDLLIEKYRAVQANVKADDHGQSKELKEKLEELELIISKKQIEITKLRNSSQGSESQIQALKDKYKESEQQLSNLQKFQIPKLKELEVNQKNLMDEFVKLKKDIDTYSSLFQIQSQTKQELLQELKRQKQTVNSLVNILGRERRTKKDLKLEIKKLDCLVMELVDENKKE